MPACCKARAQRDRKRFTHSGVFFTPALIVLAVAGVRLRDDQPGRLRAPPDAGRKRGRGWHLAPGTSPRPRGFVNVLSRQSELQGDGLFCQLPSAVPLAHLLIGFGSQYL